MVMSGQEEYEHMMFITSDFTKANEFCKKYNDHMYEDTTLTIMIGIMPM